MVAVGADSHSRQVTQMDAERGQSESGTLFGGSSNKNHGSLVCVYIYIYATPPHGSTNLWAERLVCVRI